MEYYEKQNFNQIWIKIISFISLLTGIATSILFIKESNYLIACLTFLPCFSIFIFFFIANLKVYISNNVIKYKFFPFNIKYKEIIINENISLDVIEYNPLSDFGGWGIRKNGNAKCYSTSGNFALRIKYKEGNNILLGTLKPDELKTYLDSIHIPI
ncbi:hypothetical protein ODZ84_05745 [Chryseobacterium fluminis]|uniref:hypothetical protein n=1 Tax=Chryseobacterium fluminis TaxID=2983606 RepID=UPI0022557AB0|nr:hypothetical protein [Chryseobacterium sp. MMS21-Ot14]UZT99071.1 hypothetical protein ODZ84_05745 [Chryseobacterium sp. MMS21-Ot14]